MTTYTIDQAIDLAIFNHRSGKLKESEEIFRRILSQFGLDNFRAQLYLGVLLADTGRYYEALYRFDCALKLDRRNATALSNHGMVLGELGHHEEALAELVKASKWMPDNPIIWNNIGNTLIFLERHKEALAPLNRCLALDPNHEVSHYNIGIALLRIGETERGIAHLKRSLELAPEHHEARFNMGLGQLLLGQYEEGFKNYESRWLTVNYAEYGTRFPQPKWTGEDLTGKSIIVYGDQGIGDFFMFSRYIPHIMQTGAKVYIAPHTELHDIVQSTFKNVTMLKHGDPMPNVDYRIPLPSCPMVFGTTAQRIPPPVPFVVPPKIIKKWGFTKDGPDGGQNVFSVGVCWSGNFRHINDKQRSIPLKKFKDLLGHIDGVHFYSLQYEVRPEDEEALNAMMMGGYWWFSKVYMKDYVDTFGIISDLDLIISVDTSVAHAAALIGKPTWIMIPTPRIDWRWGQSGTRTPWYPSATLYRQPREGDWDSVIATMRQDLRRSLQQAA